MPAGPFLVMEFVNGRDLSSEVEKGGPLWMLRHRLWLALVLYIAVAGAIGAGAAFYHVPAGITAAVAFLLSLLLGLEASSLRRWSLTRRRWTNVGVVIGDDVEVAERRFFDAWIRRPPAPADTPAVPAGSVQAAGASDVIGLFPEPGG